MILYHYTSTAHLPMILHDGIIRVTDSNLDMYDRTREPFVVWLLDLPDPSTANHGLDGKDDVPPANGKRWADKKEVRFTVDVPGIRWHNWPPALQSDPSWRDALTKYGGGHEAASHWYVFPAPIRKVRWREVAVRRDGEYVPYPLPLVQQEQAS